MVTCYGCSGTGERGEHGWYRTCGNCYGSGNVIEGNEPWRLEGKTKPDMYRKGTLVQVVDLEDDGVTALDGRTIWLTDSRLVGVMLRDCRLTLRNHATTTNMIVEAIGGKACYLKVPQVNDNAYVCVGDGGAFYAKEEKQNALKFTIQDTGKGLQLQMSDGDIAAFDGNNDVSIGPWRKGLSTVPLWVHLDALSIWNTVRSAGGAQ